MSISINKNEFRNAVVYCSYPLPKDIQYDAFRRGFPSSGITSKREAAMFLAQVVHESDGLRAKKEYHPPPNAYDFNNNGVQFCGRGYMQLTWRANYEAASQSLYNDSRLVIDPELVANHEDIAWNTAFWYWKDRVHDVPGVIDGHFGVSTNAINRNECGSGRIQRAKNRFEKYVKVLKALGINEPPIETGCYN